MRALFVTQKLLDRAKTGVLHGTPKIFLRAKKSVTRVQKTQLARNNFKKKVTRNSQNSRPAETDPYVVPKDGRYLINVKMIHC